MNNTNKNHDQITKLISLWKSQGQTVQLDADSIEALKWSRYATTFAPGPCYFFLFNLELWKMEYVHDSVEAVLGISPEDYSVDQLMSLHHPDDFERFQTLEKAAAEFYNNAIPKSDITRYKVSYLHRLRHASGEYKWILHQIRPMIVNKDGRIMRSIGIHSDVSHLAIPHSNSISFIGFGRPSYYDLDPYNFSLESTGKKHMFTDKEIEVIRLMAEGLSGPEIAESLNISGHTVKSYKKVIMRKSGAPNAVGLIARCIREGVI